MTVPATSSGASLTTPDLSLHVPSAIEAELQDDRRSLQADGALPTSDQLRRAYDAFRRRFGPDALSRLDGIALLEHMHAHGSRDSLVYWLEFKNDEDLPEYFGSIAGGSALKFGVFRRAETGAWAVKGPGGAPQDIPVERAVEIARRHRDQLIAAAERVERVPSSATDRDYLELQRELERVAPDIQDTAWGHKYLSLLYPETLDAFHVEVLQRYQLARLLQLPPQLGSDFATGRYVCAARFIGVARELDAPLIVSAILLNRRHGRVRSYWRIGTTDNDRERRKFWPMMRDNGIVAIGWDGIGDLSDLVNGSDSDARAAIMNRLSAHYPQAPQPLGRAASQIQKFVTGITVGDRILAADGMSVIGVGEITGPYQYRQGPVFPHTRPVEWRSLEEWRTVDAESLRTTVGSIKDYRNHVEAERHILEDAARTRAFIAAHPPTPLPVAAPRPRPQEVVDVRSRQIPLPRLTGISGGIQVVLERKGQAILYGPPGTGKTFWTLRTVRELAAQRAFGASYDAGDRRQRERILGEDDHKPALVRTCSFHPEYGYEDFIEGFRPRSGASGQLGFELSPGIFRRLCDDAVREPDLDFYLVIDEINRGDVPRIFGELLTLLERDKRGERVRLGVSGSDFSVPPNVFVLGTMNTADRSIALLDVALRRRFGFVELMPDYEVLRHAVVEGLHLGAWLKELNARIRDTGGGDARNRQIGHAFLLDRGKPIATIDQFASVLRDDIVPLLEEYAYDDFGMLAKLLGDSIVDRGAQRVRRELFDANRSSALISALNAPGVATAAETVTANPDDEDSAPVEDDASDESETLSEGIGATGTPGA